MSFSISAIGVNPEALPLVTSIIFFSSTDTSVVRTSVPVIAKPAQTIMAIDFVIFTDPDAAPDSPAVRHANGMQAS